jgi:beta-xylosidase
MGRDADGDGTGEPVLTECHPRPRLSAPAGPATSDEFDAPALGLQWQWQANPRPEWFSLQDHPGSLRLRCVPRKSSTTFWTAGHLLLQKFPAPEFEVTTLLDFHPAAEGEVSGLVVFGFSYLWLGVQRTRNEFRLVLNRCDNAHETGLEWEVSSVLLNSGKIYLRVTVTRDAQCQFAFSSGGRPFSRLGGTFQATSSYWVGAKVGVFASARGDGSDRPGYVDVDWFRVTPVSHASRT